MAIGKRPWVPRCALFALALLCGAVGSPLAVAQTLPNGIVLPTPWPPSLPGPQGPEEIPIPYLQSPPAVIPIDLGRQLLVDDFLVSESTLTRTFHQPQVRSEPVMAPTEPWELQGRAYAGPFSDGVWFDPADNMYKMWYMAGFGTTESPGRTTALALSFDGLHWTKPRLDVVPGTNIVVQSPIQGDSSTVWIDQNASNPDQRYNMWTTHFINDNPVFPWGTIYRQSPDGIHWTEVSRTPPAAEGLGDRSTVYFDPFRNVWVDSLRVFTANWTGGRDYGRIRVYHEHANPAELVTALNQVSPWWVAADPNRDPHAPDVRPELYNLDVAPYESLQVGLFSILQAPAADGYDKINEVFVGFTRDGFHWDRPNHQAFIGVSPDPDSWMRSNVQSVGAGFTVDGDTLRFYFTGRYNSTNISTGVAELRRDGFASLDAGLQPGSFTTRPVRFSGDTLFVNLAAPRGNLKVEVLDASGNPLPGFGLANAIPVAGDSTKLAVQWSGNAGLGSLAGQPVRFRFNLEEGSLYSFWVSDPAGASRGYNAAGGPSFSGPTDTGGATIERRTLLPLADAEIASGPLAATRFGTLPQLELGIEGASHHALLLKFDLRDIVADGRWATQPGELVLRGSGNDALAGLVAELWLVAPANSSWVEHQVTWNRLSAGRAWEGGDPLAGAALVATSLLGEGDLRFALSAQQINDWAANRNGDAGLLIRLVATEGGDALGIFSSRAETFFEPWLNLRLAAAVPGDANLDGRVDLIDVNFIGGRWHTAGPQGDLTRDGIVDLRDIQFLGMHWPTAAARATAIPEPPGATLAGVALALVPIAWRATRAAAVKHRIRKRAAQRSTRR